MFFFGRRRRCILSINRAMDPANSAPSVSPQDVTKLLQAWSRGERDAFDQLTAVVYVELRRLARHFMAQERRDHTLQPTALVHEAYLRLADLRDQQWQNRIHFFAMSAQIMRRV